MKMKYKFKIGDIVEVIGGMDKGIMRKITNTHIPTLQFTRSEPYYALKDQTRQIKNGRIVSIWYPESFLQHAPLWPEPMQSKPDEEP